MTAPLPVWTDSPLVAFLEDRAVFTLVRLFGSPAREDLERSHLQCGQSARIRSLADGFRGAGWRGGCGGAGVGRRRKELWLVGS